MLKIGHSVKVPPTLRGPIPGAVEDPIIRVPEELETVPGAPQDKKTVDWYSVHYPLESHQVENFVYRAWSRAVSDIKETRDEHERLNKPLIREANLSGTLEPEGEADWSKDYTDDIKDKAMELGFSMVGITPYDKRYAYKSKKNWIKPFPNAICLALEQPYEETQTIPSEPAEAAVFATYRRETGIALAFAEHIRSLGFHAQIHAPTDASTAVIPMFVAAGMGQQGAMGYLLSPYFGSRHRLMMITTDMPLDYDSPVDYGIHAFCSVCQVCVNRCPGRALMREKVWWRGVEKFKLIAKRCRPVMARYAACGICMKVCPVQRYGLHNVLDHYASTGEVLGKGTHLLEGFEMHDSGYFGPGELPRFDADFFHVPEGTASEYLLKDLTEKMSSGEVPQGTDGDEVFSEFRSRLEDAVKGPANAMDLEWDIEDMDEF